MVGVAVAVGVVVAVVVAGSVVVVVGLAVVVAGSVVTTKFVKHPLTIDKNRLTVLQNNCKDHFPKKL